MTELEAGSSSDRVHRGVAQVSVYCTRTWFCADSRCKESAFQCARYRLKICFISYNGAQRILFLKKVKLNNILIYLVNSIMWFYSCLASLTRCKLALWLIKQGSKRKSVVSDHTHFSHDTETTERITANKESFQISISA